MKTISKALLDHLWHNYTLKLLSILSIRSNDYLKFIKINLYVYFGIQTQLWPQRVLWCKTEMVEAIMALFELFYLNYFETMLEYV